MAVKFWLSVCFLQRLSQLVRAGGGLHTALDSFNTGDDILHIHTFHQGCDALQVAIAAADKLNILDLVVLNVEQNALRASALGLVFVTQLSQSPPNEYVSGSRNVHSPDSTCRYANLAFGAFVMTIVHGVVSLPLNLATYSVVTGSPLFQFAADQKSPPSEPVYTV